MVQSVHAEWCEQPFVECGDSCVCVCETCFFFGGVGGYLLGFVGFVGVFWGGCFCCCFWGGVGGGEVGVGRNGVMMH